MKPNRSFWIPEPPSTPKMLQNCFKLTKQLQSWCLLSITAVSSTGPLSSKSCRRNRETPNSAAKCSFSLLTFGRGLAATKVGFSAGRLGLESKLCPNPCWRNLGLWHLHRKLCKQVVGLTTWKLFLPGRIIRLRPVKVNGSPPMQFFVANWTLPKKPFSSFSKVSLNRESHLLNWWKRVADLFPISSTLTSTMGSPETAESTCNMNYGDCSSRRVGASNHSRAFYASNPINWHKFWKIDSLLDISAGIAAIPWVFTLDLPFNPRRGRNASNKPPLCVNLSRASALKLSRNPGAANRWFRCLFKISHSEVEKRWPIEVKKVKLITLLHCPVQPVLPSPSTFMPNH